MVSDTTFKYLFKEEKSRKWIEEIIYSKTGIDLSNFILVDNEDNTGNRIKDYRMDLLLSNCKEENLEYVIVEMNREYSNSMEIKGRQYLFRKASHGYDKGDKYVNPPKVKLVMLNNYLNKKDEDIKTIKYELRSKEYDLKYDEIEIYEIYLKLFHEMCYDKCEEIDKRLWLFGTTTFEEMNEVKDNNNAYIIEELERLSMDDKFREEYDWENIQRKLMNSMRIEGYEEGYTNGIEEGMEQKNIEIAKSMLEEKIDINVVSRVTKLSKEELEKMK